MSPREGSRRTIGVSELAADLGVSPFEVLSAMGLDMARIREALREHGHEGLDEATALTALIRSMRLELRPSVGNGTARIDGGAPTQDENAAASAASRDLSLGREVRSPMPPADPVAERDAVPPGWSTEVARRAAPTELPPFAEFIRVLRTYKWMFLGTVLAVFTTAVMLSFATPPSYHAEATVLVQAIADPSGGSVEDVNMATQTELVESNLIASRVAADLGLDVPPETLASNLDVDQPEDTEVLELGYTADSPQEAEVRAQAFVDAYLEYRREQAAWVTTEERAAISEEIATLEERLASINQSLASASAAEESRLQSEANQIAARIVERQLRLSAISVEPNVGVVLGDAHASFKPVSPDHVVNAILGLFAALLLGVSVTVLRDRLDDRVHTGGAIESMLDRPLFAELTDHPREGLMRRSRLPALHLPESPVAETYRLLAVELNAARLLSDGPLVLTEARRSSDASIVAANLGVVLARSGKRVLLVDADLHQHRVTSLFGLEPGPGFLGAATGRHRASKAILRTDVERLDVMPPGADDGSVDELSPESVEQLAARLMKQYDVVLVDTPHVAQEATSMLLVGALERVLLAVDSGCPRRTIGHAARAIAKAGGRSHGLVVTKVPAAWISVGL